MVGSMPWNCFWKVYVVLYLVQEISSVFRRVPRCYVWFNRLALFLGRLRSAMFGSIDWHCFWEGYEVLCVAR